MPGSREVRFRSGEACGRGDFLGEQEIEDRSAVVNVLSTMNCSCCALFGQSFALARLILLARCFFVRGRPYAL